MDMMALHSTLTAWVARSHFVFSASLRVATDVQRIKLTHQPTRAGECNSACDQVRELELHMVETTMVV